MKVSDRVAEFIKSLGVEKVFGVVGGGSMHLNDSFRDIFVPMHHEQAAAFAADAYARVKGIGCCLVTTGPGGTNALTGVACSWIDSVPVIYISGQVTRNQLLQGTGLRQFGVQESDILALVKPNVKYANRLMHEDNLDFTLRKAAISATTGRKGPVWIDIPLDVQSRV